MSLIALQCTIFIEALADIMKLRPTKVPLTKITKTITVNCLSATIRGNTRLSMISHKN